MRHATAGRSRAAFYGVLWSLLNTLTPTMVGLLVFVVTSHNLSPGDFGVVAMAASVATIASALVPAGFGQALVQRIEVAPAHLNTVFWFSLTVATIGYVSLFAAAGPIAQMLSTPILGLLIPLLGLRVFFDMLALVPNALLQRRMAYRQLATRTFVASLASASVCLLLILLNLGLWALVASQLVTSLALSTGSLVAARWSPRLSFSLRAFREVAWYGLMESFDRSIVSLSLDQMILGSVLGTVPLGLYNFSKRTTQLLNDAISGGLNSVSYTLMASLQNERDKGRRAFLLAVFLSSSICFPMFVGLALIADDLVPLAFGEQWRQAIPILRCFCALGLLVPITVLQSSLVKSQGRPHYWLIYDLAKLIVTSCAVFYCSRYGVNITALALVGATFAVWFPSAALVAQTIGTPFRQYLSTFARPALCALAMIGYVLGVDALMPNHPAIARLAAMIATGAVVYTSLFLLLAHRDIWQAMKLIRTPAPV